MSTPIRVLVAEDRPIARKIILDELSVEGIEVVGLARDGIECVDLTFELEPDVVVCDVDMPGMDGIRALREIRKHSDVPVIVFSGARVDPETLRMVAERAGANGFILKPSGPVSVDVYAVRDQLLGMVRDVAAEARTASESYGTEPWAVDTRSELLANSWFGPTA